MKRAVVSGLLAASMMVGGFASAPGATAVTAAADGVPVVGIGPGDVFSFGKSVYDKFQECLKNIEQKLPCGNSDGDNIREALKRLDAVQDRMVRDQDALQERLNELGMAITESDVRSYKKVLRSLESNSNLAMQAWVALVDCQVVQSTGGTECAEFLDDDRVRQVPVQKGLDGNRQQFLYYAGNLPADIPSTVATYTGTTGAGDRSSLAYALWRLAKARLDADAGVSNSTIRTSEFTPFVTPKMSAEVNGYLDYYTSLFQLWGNVLHTRAQLLRDEARASGSSEYDALERTADRIEASIDRRIEATTADSVKGVEALYRLTRLSQGDIMMADSNGTGAIVYSAEQFDDGDRRMRDTDVFALGQGLANFGVTSKLAQEQPEAFPSTDRWYEVIAPVQVFGCSHAQYEIPVVALARSKRIPEFAGPVTWGPVRMRLLDAKPAWDSKYMERFPCVYRGGPQRYVVNFQESLAANVKWPATYDWNIRELPVSFFYTGLGGYGAFVDRPRPDQRVNRIAEQETDNKMVRWPTGFTPQDMPAAYDGGDAS